MESIGSMIGTFATHAADCAVLFQQSLIVMTGVLGGFNRSSQHFDMEVMR